MFMYICRICLTTESSLSPSLFRTSGLLVTYQGEGEDVDDDDNGDEEGKDKLADCTDDEKIGDDAEEEVLMVRVDFLV